MNDTFSKFHPVVNFTFFVSVIGYSMFIMHPVILCITLLSAMAYSIYLGKKSAMQFNTIYMLPMMLIVALINPLFNHSGETILLYINDNPITLEALVYGVVCAMMFLSVILWFSCYNRIMTSDKFIYIFGRIIPALSLIFSMVLRFVPKYKA
ncbi:MAG: energy-coupling factor transporter transmembrane component T, partial [Oscillospiraceae bacterium]